MASIYDYQITEMNNEVIDLSQYKGKVLIIVNTASKCGLANQLETLEQLYKKYHDQGLMIIGCPSNQFHQELGDDQSTNDYCQMHYGVTFPMTKQMMINGSNENPLFTYLKFESNKGKIKWNYTKFLLGRDGQLIHRYAPITKPEKMEIQIKNALEKE